MTEITVQFQKYCTFFLYWNAVDYEITIPAVAPSWFEFETPDIEIDDLFVGFAYVGQTDRSVLNSDHLIDSSLLYV